MLFLSCYFHRIFFVRRYFACCLVEMAESGLEKRRFLWILYKFCIPIKIKSKTVDKWYGSGYNKNDDFLSEQTNIDNLSVFQQIDG